MISVPFLTFEVDCLLFKNFLFNGLASFKSENSLKKNPVRVGVSVLSFLSLDHTIWGILEVKDNRRSLT